MARRNNLALIVLLTCLPFLFSSIASEAQEIVRNKKMGVDMHKYYGVSDPKLAADELEKVAIENGSDLDYVQPTQLNICKGYEPFRISTARRTFIPTQVADDEFRSELTRLQQEGKGDSALICILQTNRHISLRETISLLRSGVTIYEDISDFAIIAKMPSGTALGLLNAPYLGWIGEFKGIDKFAPPDEFASDQACYVASFEGDKPEFRSDLKRLGIDVLYYFPAMQTYMVTAGRSRYLDIAALWWVRRISTIGKIGTLGKAGKAGLETALTTDLTFKAQDSRSMINSWINSYPGSNVLVGIYDDGFKSTYFNKHSASIAAHECYHGTHVAGILAGHSVSGQYGNIYQGVAAASSILYVGFSGDYTKSPQFALGWFDQYGARTSNYSIYDAYQAPYRYRYDYGANTDNSAMDTYADRHGMVLVASCGNDGCIRPEGQNITRPGNAKNVLSVGAIYYVSSSDCNEDIGMRAIYSSTGPTFEDYRLAPHIVAPGGGGGGCATCGFDFGVVSCKGADKCGRECDFWDAYNWPYDANYYRMGGTSMAAPHVTGAVAQILNWKSNSNPPISTELVKALVINTAIPLKENTDDASAGYASTKVGFGLVNPYLCTVDIDDNAKDGFKRLRMVTDSLAYQGDESPRYGFDVEQGTKKLVISMAYNDLAGMRDEINRLALKDNLDLHVFAPGGVEVTVNRTPDGTLQEIPMEKVVIEDPVVGHWEAMVKFQYSFGAIGIHNQAYGLVVDAISKTPALEISSLSNIEATVGDPFDVSITVTNVGGFIAAGITMKLGGALATFGGLENSDPVYIGNILVQDGSITKTYSLTPSQTGTFSLTAEVNGINREFKPPDYPKTKTITVTVKRRIAGAVTIGRTGRGMAGVEITGIEGDSVLTGADGSFEKSVTTEWSGRISAHYPDSSFYPSSIWIPAGTSDLWNQNFHTRCPEDPRARVEYCIAYKGNAGITIEWKTNTERDTHFFQVQKCVDAERDHYITLMDSIFAKGSDTSGASYEYIDLEGKIGDLYRLIESETGDYPGIQAFAKAKGLRPSEAQIPMKPEYDLAKLHSETKELLTAGGAAIPRAPATENLKWVAIYPQVFEYEIQQLIAWRQQHNLFAAGGISIEAINSSYGSIKDYIQHLWDTQGHQLQYVFLVGDASSCAYYPSFCSSTTHNIIPIFRYEEGFDGYPYYSDVEYGDIDADGYAEVAIGRLPAYVNQDVAVYINKVIYYEQHWTGSWVDDVSFLVCDKDINFCTGDLADSLATLLAARIPGTFNPHYKSMRELFPIGGLPDYAERETVAKGEFDSGRSLILAMGTVASETDLAEWLNTAWYEESPFRINKLQANHIFPFVIGASCDIGNFTADWQDANDPPITQQLLFDPARGAIAMYCPTSATDQEGNYEVCDMLLEYLYDWGAPSLGHACISAQKRVMATKSMSESTARSYVFFGDPAIRLAGSIYASGGTSRCLVTNSYVNGKTNYLSCPAGDAEKMVLHLNFEYDFGAHPDIPASAISVVHDAASVPFTLFGGGSILADSAATSSNNYQTTVSFSKVGGCGCGDLFVKVGSDTVGLHRVCFRGPDITNNGYVNLSDLIPFNSSYGKNYPEPGFNYCCDFNDDNKCDLTDLASYGTHYQHHYSGGGTLTSDALQISDSSIELELQEPGTRTGEGLVCVAVRLANPTNVNALCFGLVMDNALEYRGSHGNPSFSGMQLVSKVVRDGKDVLFITILGEDDHKESLPSELLTLEFMVRAGVDPASAIRGLALAFGDAMESDGAIRSLRGIEVETILPAVPVRHAFLANNYPNPFNPTTQIRYGIEVGSWVNLSIYNVNGQLVRTLVNERQRSNEYSAVWNGKDNAGRNVASGIYFYKLEAERFTATKKLVLLR